LLARGEVLGERFCRSAPQNHPMPVRAFLALTGFVAPDLCGGDVQRRDRRTARRVPVLGITPEITDEDHSVYAAHVLTTSRGLSVATLEPLFLIACGASAGRHKRPLPSMSGTQTIPASAEHHRLCNSGTCSCRKA